MGTIKRFEDIIAWKKARILVREIYKITLRDRFSKDFALKEQIRRAAISIMLNIAEGFARRTDKEFAQFLVQAHGSTAEVQSALYIALDQGYFTQECFTELYKLSEEISRAINSFEKYLRN